MQVDIVNTLKPDQLKKGDFLEKPAHQLAEDHAVIHSPAQDTRLLADLSGWKESLREAYQYFKTTSSQDLGFSRANEWMLDNFYIVEQTLRQINQDMPPSYYRQLPYLEMTALK